MGSVFSYPVSRQQPKQERQKCLEPCSSRLDPPALRCRIMCSTLPPSEQTNVQQSRCDATDPADLVRCHAKRATQSWCRPSTRRGQKSCPRTRIVLFVLRCSQALPPLPDVQPMPSRQNVSHCHVCRLWRHKKRLQSPSLKHKMILHCRRSASGCSRSEQVIAVLNGTSGHALCNRPGHYPSILCMHVNSAGGTSRQDR